MVPTPSMGRASTRATTAPISTGCSTRSTRKPRVSSTKVMPISFSCARNQPPTFTRRACSTGSTRFCQASGSFRRSMGRARGSLAEMRKLEATAVPRNTRVSGRDSTMREASPSTCSAAPWASWVPLSNSSRIPVSIWGRRCSGARWARFWSHCRTRPAAVSRPMATWGI